jgi:hypothetical protein
MAITDPGNPGDVGRKRNIPMAQSIQPGRFGLRKINGARSENSVNVGTVEPMIGVS